MRKLCLLPLAAASLIACKKDHDNNPVISRMDLLTSKNWRITAFTNSSAIVGGATSTLDSYAKRFILCNRDNFIKFDSNKSVTVDEGLIKCDPLGPQNASGTWAFSANDTKLLFPEPDLNDIINRGLLGGQNSLFDIVDLSSTTLHIQEITYYSYNGTKSISTRDIVYTSF